MRANLRSPGCAFAQPGATVAMVAPTRVAHSRNPGYAGCGLAGREGGTACLHDELELTAR